MKNVLFVVCTNFFGGAEYVLCDYLKDNHENNIYIYTTNKKNIINKFSNILRTDKVFASEKMSAVSIRKRPVKSTFNILYNLYKIHQIVKKYKIQVIYGNNTLDTVLICLYKHFFNKKIKIISHIHDIVERNLYKKFLNKNKAYVDIYIVPSIATKKSLLKCDIDKNKIQVIYNGITIIKNIEHSDYIRCKYNISNDKKILCFVGQICKRKRLDLFIDIINELNQKTNNNYIGIIIGKIIDINYYEQLRKKMNKSILYLGELKRNNIIKYIYPEITALLLTSNRDPLPTVLLEAMASGTLVIARDVDGVKEIIDDKKDGFIFSYNSDIQDISKIVDNILVFDNENIKLSAIKKIQQKFSNDNKQRIINNIIKNI